MRSEKRRGGGRRRRSEGSIEKDPRGEEKGEGRGRKKRERKRGRGGKRGSNEEHRIPVLFSKNMNNY